MRWSLLLVVCVTHTLVFSHAFADDEKVPLDKVPSPVIDAVKKRFPKSEIVGAEKETENGKVTYEINLKDNGQNIDVILSAEGSIQTIEKEIAVKDLPKVVAEALAAKYPKAICKKYEEVYKVKDGKEALEYYEVLLDTENKKDIEVEITPDGKIKN